MTKKIGISLLTVISVFIWHADAGASWLVDARKYHISAHGQVSCLDCHESISDLDIHPNAASVAKEVCHPADAISH